MPWFTEIPRASGAGCALAVSASNLAPKGGTCVRRAERNIRSLENRLRLPTDRGEEYVDTVSKKQIPLLDLQAQHKQIRDEVLAEIVRVVDSQKFILGEDVKKLETEIASYRSEEN